MVCIGKPQGTLLRHSAYSANVRYLGGICGGGGVQPDGCHWSGREFVFLCVGDRYFFCQRDRQTAAHVPPKMERKAKPPQTRAGQEHAMRKQTDWRTRK